MVRSEGVFVLSDYEYDTDDVSVTETIYGTDEEFMVDAILAETIDNDFDVYYLVKWQNWHFCSATWEPKHGITEVPGVVAEWEKKKKQLGNRLDAHNEHFYELHQTARIRRAEQRERKAAKIAPLKKTKRRTIPDNVGKSDDSDSDAPPKPAKPAVSADDEESLFVQRGGTPPRRQPLYQSSSENESGDSVMEELKNSKAPETQISLGRSLLGEKRNSTTKGPPEAPNNSGALFGEKKKKKNDSANAAQGTKQNRSREAPATHGLRGHAEETLSRGKVNARVCKDDHPSTTSRHAPPPTASKDVPPPTAPTDVPSKTPKDGPHSKTPTARGTASASASSALASSAPPPLLSLQAPLSAPPSSSSLTATNAVGSTSRPPQSLTVAKRTGAGPIRMVNKPKVLSRSEWKNSDKLYSTVKFRRTAELRSRNEQTPDVAELEFVNRPPGGISQPSSSSAPPPCPPPTGPRKNTRDDNPYGRRDSTQFRPQGGERGSPGSAPDSPIGSAELPDWAKNKIPLTCFEWRNGSCRYSWEKCRFQHMNGFPLSPADGSVPSKYTSRPLTCFHWFKKPNGCVNTAEECKFAHRNTGVLAVPGNPEITIDPTLGPYSERKTCHFWANKRCRYTDEECKFAHRHTGEVAKKPGRFAKHSSASAPAPRKNSGHGAPPFPQSQPDNASYAPQLMNDNGPMSTDQRMPQTVDIDRSRAVRPSNEEMQRLIGRACKLDYGDIFKHNEAFLDRRVFLIFHPGHHAAELELVTRWMLIHHAEVFNFWVDGSWDKFRQEIEKGGTGVIMAHADFERFEDIPGFGTILSQQVQVYSIGYQYSRYYDPEISASEPEFAHDCIVNFPHGGIIYITDEVFESQPKQALELVQHFFAKVEKVREQKISCDAHKLVDDGLLLWRLATRPDLMKSIFDAYEKHAKTIYDNDIRQSSRFQLYKVLTETGYVQQDDNAPFTFRPLDYFPVMSERRFEDYMSDYYVALDRGQEDANDYMVGVYAEYMIERRRFYRQYFVVHTKPKKVREMFHSRWQHLVEVMTPGECIEYFEQPGQGNRFEFYEWASETKIKTELARKL
ncbi:hypothetical protein EJ04DRAFT_555345 [Polyplosphaeria fusca]|uniref:Chromo domain-containing protein n=1 Tax=Polyplosphaeria fusca TaxID=682080 RepID=A0A9P4UZ15_9PLEO|nr:hypothetical protein EJ04DRAFT_555345 [Polyplosphaeria fusca]